MTLRWLEGFETEQNNVSLARKYSAGSAINAVNTYPAGRLLGSSYRSDPGTPSIFRVDFSVSAVWTMGMAFRTDSGVYTGSDWWLFRILDLNGTEQISLWLADGSAGFLKLQVKQGAIVLYESEGFPISGDWQYVEWKVAIHTTTGNLEVRHNKKAVIAASNVNTAASGIDNNGTSVEFGCGVVVGQEFDIDDVYILNAAGSDPQFYDFLGPVAIKGVLPSADYAPLEMVPSTGPDHFAVIDNAPDDASPESDYLEGASPQQSFVTLGSLGEVKGGILGMQVGTVRALDQLSRSTLSWVSTWISGWVGSWMGPFGVPSTEVLSLYQQRKARNDSQEPAQLIDNIGTISTLYRHHSTVIQQDPLDGGRLSSDDVEQGHLGLETV
jgi:hypothetical protein